MPFPLIAFGGGIVAAGVSSWLVSKRTKTRTVSTVKDDNVSTLLKQYQQDVNKRAETADHDFKLAMVATGASGIATLAYPPLLFVSVPLTLYGSIPIFRDSWIYWREKRKLHSGIIDSIAIVGTLASGYYFSAAIINSMYFLGQKVLLKTENQSGQKLQQLFGESPKSVWLLRDEVELEVPFDQVEVGQTVVCHSGETIPFDGKVIAGEATVDQHVLTGEAQPQEKQTNDVVYASTLLTSGTLHIQVEKAGKDTVASQITDVLQNTLDFKSTIEAKGTRITNQLTLPTIALSGLALGTLGPVSASAVANCNFSDIVRITIPLGVLNHLKMAAEQGILIKDGRALELLGDVDTIVFDKTGTLTLEEPTLARIHTFGSFSDTHILSLAAAAEGRQTHPVARAILSAAEQRGLQTPPVHEAEYELGNGIRCRIQGQDIILGSQRFMEDSGIPISDVTLSTDNSHSIVWLAIDNHIAGALELSPKIRPEIPSVISTLRKRGMQLHILSGDHENPTRELAETLKISHYRSNALPEDKTQYIRKLQNEGRQVCFIGDGLNDTLAMKQAQVAISLSGASNVATDTAGIVFLNQSLTHMDQLFSLAQGFRKNMNSGLVWSILPGVAGIGAVFAAHMKIYGAVGLYLLSLGGGVANASLPLLKKKQATKP